MYWGDPEPPNTNTACSITGFLLHIFRCKYITWTKLRNQEGKKRPWKGLGRRSSRHSVVDRSTMIGKTGQAIEGRFLSRLGQMELRRNREGEGINNTKDDWKAIGRHTYFMLLNFMTATTYYYHIQYSYMLDLGCMGAISQSPPADLLLPPHTLKGDSIPFCSPLKIHHSFLSNNRFRKMYKSILSQNTFWLCNHLKC